MLRFAPSPTGFLHMGNIRVALVNYLYAKKNNLNFFLRIDDTDQERSKVEFIESIIEDLEWLGIHYKKVIKQSERISKYKEIFDFLKSKNFIYPCFESADELSLKRKILLKQGKPPIYDRTSLRLKKSEIQSLIQSGKRPHWRLKLDDETIEWSDMIHGKIVFSNLSVSDPVVFRSDEMPLFTITSVVDDADTEVSHIFRGDDHITNTAAQIKLFKLIDAKIPEFGHFPLIKSISGQGLSKRSDDFSVRQFRKQKVSQLVLINYLQKIGTNQSFENIDDMKTLYKNFNINNFSKNSVFFDPNDIERINSKYLKNLDIETVKKTFNVNFENKFWLIVRSNINSIDEAKEWFDLVQNNFLIENKIILKKPLKSIILKFIPEKVDKDFWSVWTNKILENFEIKPKVLYITLRQILTGKKYGPSMNDLLTLIRKDEIIKRVESNCEEED